MTMAITGNVTYTTIATEKFDTIRKRVTALRRMKTETLLALCDKYYPDGFHVEYMNNKGDAFPFILQAEFGVLTMEAYHNEVARRLEEGKRSRRRGQLVLV